MVPTVTLEILQVPGCPGADLLAARLESLLAGRPRVTRRVVTSQADAERLGMPGSPTPASRYPSAQTACRPL